MHYKSKIRGWKRRLYHIENWYKNNTYPDFEAFEKYYEDYVKIRIDPWNRVCERNPPHWYSKAILARLIDIYDRWEIEYEKQNKLFDLQIWINDPNFIRSQIVCAKVDKEGIKRNNYFRKANEQTIFPKSKWNSKVYDLDKFVFEEYMDEDFAFENIENLEPDDIKELIEEGYQKDEITIDGKPETRYSKRVGSVWIGRKKAANIKYNA